MTAGSRRADLRTQAKVQKAKFEEANAKVTARVGRNLVFAITSGVALAALFLTALFVWEPLLAIVAAAAVSFALYELATAFRFSGRRVPRIGVIIGGLIIVYGAWFYRAEGMLAGLLVASLLLVFWRLIEATLPRFEAKTTTIFADLAAGIFCLIYIPFLLSIVLLLRQIPVNGQWWVFTLILLPVCCDIGAYAAGVSFGKHKMAPRISPNKTWEGFAGAAVAVVAAGSLAAAILLAQPWWLGALLGVGVLITATGGDLVESLIKRNLGVKDMSSLIPGHGGLLDRLDSIIPSAVPLYAGALFVGVL